MTGATHVILAFSAAPDRGLVQVIRDCEALGLEVSLVPRLFESITDRVALDRLGGLPLLGPALGRPARLAVRLQVRRSTACSPRSVSSCSRR